MGVSLVWLPASLFPKYIMSAVMSPLGPKHFRNTDDMTDDVNTDD
jgi:hypothetical protein